MTTLSEFHRKQIDWEIASSARHLAHIRAASEAHKSILLRLERVLPQLDGVSPAMPTYVHSYAYNYDTTNPRKVRVGYTIGVRIKNFSDMIPIFEKLEEDLDPLFPSISVDTWKSEDRAGDYTREYSTKVQIFEEVMLVLTFAATLPGDTDTCRRVIVGYRNDEPQERLPEPIYELQCGEPGETPE